ncbi:hypothetical protein B7463_g7449, partial [Scytalidium lignicola]
MQYNGKSFEDTKKQLASYKSTISIIFASINLRENSSTQGSLDDLKNSIRDTRGDLGKHLDQVQQAVESAEASSQKMFQEDIERLQGSLDSLARAQQVADSIESKIVIEGNLAGQGSRAIFGSDASQPQFSLKVSKNEAQLSAVMAAGVHSPETLQALLQDSRTPDIALTLQALQMQSQNSSPNSLQSILNILSAQSMDRSSHLHLAQDIAKNYQLDTTKPQNVISLPGQLGNSASGVMDRNVGILEQRMKY